SGLMAMEGLSVSLAADQGDEARQIIAESRSLSDGVELPSRLFTTLRKRLSITKGALLLYDPLRLEYAPWASYGFDQTTLHRMRIPLGANETFNALANGDPLQVTASEQLSAFQQFFSSREFSSLTRLVLCPYIHDETLVGALLATEIQHPSLDTAGLLSCLKGVANEISPALQKARGFLMKLSQARAARPPAAPEERIARLLESPAALGKKMLFLSLSLGPYVRGIAATHEDLDLFRLREDVHSLMDAFLADLGVAVLLPAGNLLVCLQDVLPEDIPLFLHQLRYFLNVHFAGALPTEKAPRIDVLKSRIWPDEGTDPAELVAFFSS
ncbi:MAG TPA: hypothetical protein VMM82_12020, partial [Spirochaetia bacterium]|nr:hypothetical protein [Spirochaetia bacterium]